MPETKNLVARPDGGCGCESAQAGAAGAAAGHALASGAVDGSAAVATCDGVDAQDSGVSAGLASSRAESRANLASERGAVGDNSGSKHSGRDSLAYFDVMYEKMRGLREVADNLPAGGGAISNVEVVDVDIDLVVNLAGESVEHAVDCVK